MGFFKRNKTKPANLNEEFNPWAFERANTPIESVKTVPEVIKLVTDRSATFYVGSQPYTVDSESESFPAIKAELAKANPDVDKLIGLVDVAKTVKQTLSTFPQAVNYLTKGVINVTREGVTYNNEPLHNALADRLMAVLESGGRIAPWIKFAENLYQNPSEYARDELGEWLEAGDLPLTDDGHFLAYKIVGPNFMDLWKGQFDNSPGKIVQLAGRHQVDPNRRNLCSYGLHFCSKSYLPQYGTEAGNRVVLVKINPADVVSIPAEYGRAKGRTWRYEVLEEIDRGEAAIKDWDPVFGVEDADYADDWDSPEDDELEDPADHDPAFGGLPIPAQHKAPVVKKANKARKGKALSAKKADDMSIKELRRWLRENRPTKGARIMTRAELVKAATS